jgi:NADPH2 dehydrogenase
MPKLFDPIHIKGMELKNRVMMSPMCMYSVVKEDGAPNEWHDVHYTSRAIGGTGLIMIEATSVEPNGRISYQDLGIWSDDHIAPFQRVIESCQNYGAKVGIQIGHAGRKAMLEGSDIVGPMGEAFSDKLLQPRSLSTDEVKKLVESFAMAARRAVKAGVDTVEIHGAHGYLINQFLSPRSNQRTDEYGELLKFPLEVITAVKAELPANMPLLLRVSGTEYNEGGYTIDQMVGYCQHFKAAGVDTIDVSSGGDGPKGPSEVYPGFQVPLAARIKHEVEIPVIAVGLLEEPALAQHVVSNGQADMIAIARGILRDAYWTNTAAVKLGSGVQLPKQYARAY